MSVKIHIARPFVEALANNFPELDSLKQQLLFGDRVEVLFSDLSASHVDHLHELYGEAGPAMQNQQAQLATLRRAFDSAVPASPPTTWKPWCPRSRLPDAGRPARLAVHPRRRGRPLPYVVARIDYTPQNNDETGRILVELKANSKGELTTALLRISAGDIVGRTVAEIFAAKGFVQRNAGTDRGL